uniref:BTB domain-containing protein n=1 Tax=Steinernema glaseri TaxID=37863 RepID=A0A1I7YY12_9BILA
MATYRAKWDMTATKEQLLRPSGHESMVIQIGDLGYKIEALITGGYGGKPQALTIELICDTFNTNAAILYNFTYHCRLIVSGAGQRLLEKKDSGSVSYVANPIGFDFSEKQVPFLDELSISMDVRFDSFRTLDLSQYSPFHADTLLIVRKNMQIYVSKSLLSYYSPFFNEFFQSNNYIQLQPITYYGVSATSTVYYLDVEFYGFLIFIYCIYGFREPDLSLVYEPLTTVMDLPLQYQCPMAMEKIESNLMAIHPPMNERLFEKADECGMYRLISQLLKTLTIDELKDLSNRCMYEECFTPSTRHMIMEEMADYL